MTDSNERFTKGPFLRSAVVLPAWFVLGGGNNWADIEGTSAEWAEVAKAVRARKPISYKRVAFDGAGLFWSPRNAWSDRDYVRVQADKLDGLADNIKAALASARGEKP